MSYRAFKRLLGETSLERKCRWLLGTGVLVLMSASFYTYAKQNEGLAYEQLTHTGRTLVPSIVARLHVTEELQTGLDQFQTVSEETWTGTPGKHTFHVFRPKAPTPNREPSTDENLPDVTVLNVFLTQSNENEHDRSHPTKDAYLYYGAIRAGPTCVACHRSREKLGQYLGLPPEDSKVSAVLYPELEPGQLMAVARVELSTETIDVAIHQNRALLITFAFGTTVLILIGSYAVIRYVIVKPVKHLKSVSDAIAAGHLNVRSEIQTNDEFEDLSHAFNRMLRNLTNMQDRNRGLIADLDKKVDELARMNMALFESNKLKGDFLHTMSHELRTPLNSIIGFSEVLLNGENLTEKQHRWAGNIMTSGQQLLALINDILELAKLEAGKMKLRPKPIDPRTLCEQAAALYRVQAEAKSIDLRVEVSPDAAPIYQDAGKLNQVLNNLISNAIKFTPEGGRITVRAETLGDRFLLTVSDTGVGIAPGEQELVFDKFRQASNPLTREQGGSGLGLSIVRETAKLLGGEVTLQSDLGRGSTFTVRVAARLPDDPAQVFEPLDESSVVSEPPIDRSWTQSVGQPASR